MCQKGETEITGAANLLTLPLHIMSLPWSVPSQLQNLGNSLVPFQQDVTATGK